MTIDPRSDRPIYRQVADILRAQIADGTLAPGEMLPSEKQLADGYAVGRDAMRQAIAVLRMDGLVRTIKGRGTSVRDRPSPIEVRLVKGSRVNARMPTEAERRSLDVEDGVPVLVVNSPGLPTQIYSAASVSLLA